MALFTKGTTYSAGSEVNAANLEALVTNASLAGVSRFDCDRPTVCPATVKSTELDSPDAKEVWIIEDQYALAAYIDSEWYGLTPAFQAVRANEDISNGQVVTFSGFGSEGRMKVSVADGSAPGAEVGVAAHDIASGDVGIIVISGVVSILFSDENGPASPGVLLSMSSTKGSVKSRYATDTSVKVVAQAMGADVSGAVVAWLRR